MSVSLRSRRLRLSVLALALVSVVFFVGLQVILERLLLAEGQSTDGTDGIRPPAVNLLVAPQCSGSGEALSADVAAVWFDSCVTPHVRVHVLKRLPADLTCPPTTAAGFSVRSEMLNQTV